MNTYKQKCYNQFQVDIWSFTHQKGNNLIMNDTLWLALILAAIFVVAIVGIIFVVRRRRKAQGLVKPEARDPEALIMHIRGINKLASVTYREQLIHKYETHRNASAFTKWLRNDSVLMVAHGEIMAGIDLSKMQREDITIRGGAIQIRLPQPEIIMSKLDNEKTWVERRVSGRFANTKDTETLARIEAEQKMLQTANEGGILEEAFERIQQPLTQFLTSMGFSQIDIYLSGGTYKYISGQTIIEEVLPDRLLPPPTK
jgi:hypothetical protein